MPRPTLEEPRTLSETRWSDVERWLENICSNCGNLDVQDYIIALHLYRERTKGFNDRAVSGPEVDEVAEHSDDIARGLGLE